MSRPQEHECLCGGVEEEVWGEELREGEDVWEMNKEVEGGEGTRSRQ